ncbi:MAG: hypothetical protein A3J47_02245 [Candidatus Yanofskybacteria bacterium RIFCSPHIGHO2_02_FULL_43_22]|uniref:YrhK domain-containing protein n=1 Tax=Candidatus Yanofskybacteria bacterium RIFCSPHIGHO2_02_FULL_43_22 TaxID=1802681 RepID=A0A1F8FLQ9_9BACT|nr:MAG: hypothetical protein A3J47_02245 [Candidatus Yanofskybacteria bacterium RIFCSPHIGHO2_02_FULL_43_22]
MSEETRHTLWDKLLITICTLGASFFIFGSFLMLSLPFVGKSAYWPSAKFICTGVVLIALSVFLDRLNKNKPN